MFPSESFRPRRTFPRGVFLPGKRSSGKWMTLTVSAQEALVKECSYIVSIAKKVAPKAVDRNLLRRRIRSVLREFAKTTAKPHIFTVHTKKGIADLPFRALKEELMRLLTNSAR